MSSSRISVGAVDNLDMSISWEVTVLKAGLVIAVSMFTSNLVAESTGGPSSKLMSWNEFSALPPESQQAYLERVQDVIERFEGRLNETLLNDEVSLLFRLQEFYAQNLSLVSDAEAELKSIATPTPPVKPKTTTPTTAGPTNSTATPKGPSPKVLPSINVGKKPVESAGQGRPPASAPNPSRVQSQPTEAKPSAASENKCVELDSEMRSQARKDYRKKGNFCLIGGEVSHYDKDGGSCPPVNRKKHRGGEAACTVDNTFSGGPRSAATSKRITLCNPDLYCKKSQGGETKPFCVKVAANVLSTCKSAVKSSQKGEYAFGLDCFKSPEEGKKVLESLSKTIDQLCWKRDKTGVIEDQSAGLLCRDCNNLESDLTAALAKNKAPSDSYESEADR